VTIAGRHPKSLVVYRMHISPNSKKQLDSISMSVLGCTPKSIVITYVRVGASGKKQLDNVYMPVFSCTSKGSIVYRMHISPGHKKQRNDVRMALLRTFDKSLIKRLQARARFMVALGSCSFSLDVETMNSRQAPIVGYD